MRYIATVNGEEFSVAIDQPAGVIVRNTGRSVHLERIDGEEGAAEALLCLFVDGKPHEVFAERRGSGYCITIGGAQYEVRVEEERLRWVSGQRGEPGGEVGQAVVTSPMPGIVADVLVQEGQRVQAGDRLAILEAMKMENEIRAPCAGVVERVHVVSGQTVNLRDVIVSIGPLAERGSSGGED